MDCIFCNIINDTLPAQLIYEDEKLIVFNDLYPRAPIHQLIVPRKHIACLNDLTESDTPLVGHMIWVAQQMAKQAQIAESGYRTVFNCNRGAGQAVFHIHLHLLGGRKLNWPPG